MPRRFPVWLLALLLATISSAGAEGPCADGPHADAAARLAALGYDAETFETLLTWHERARDGSEAWVIGHRVRHAARAEAFDVYTTASGTLLGDADLVRMGIAPKDWSRPAVRADAAWGVNEGKAATAPLPRTVIWGSGAPAEVTLPPIDRAAIAAEDALAAARSRGRMRRIGVFVDVPGGVWVAGADTSDGAWRSTPDGGAVWQATLEADDAEAVRVEFAELALPAGGQAVVYNADAPSEAYGPYNGSGEGQWAATCFGPRVTIECYVADWADREAVRLTVERAIHVYVPFGALAWAKAEVDDSCWIDVNCRPEWATLKNAVAGMGTVATEGYIWCTGTLLVDLDETTERPLFLTAYHCLDYDGYGASYAQSTADNLEIYWLYQTDACDGTPPDPTDVPRTSAGADYLAGMPDWSGNDFALVRLRRDPPASAVFAGWDAEAPQTDAAVSCIQHPNGSYKRVSIGAVSETDANYVDVVWSEGVTAVGSSGSPLIDAESDRVIGQLLGGYSYCDAPQGADSFGRFDVTYAVIASYLRGEGFDDEEPEPEPEPEPGDGGDAILSLFGCAPVASASGETQKASAGDMGLWLGAVAALAAAGRRRRRGG